MEFKKGDWVEGYRSKRKGAITKGGTWPTVNWSILGSGPLGNYLVEKEENGVNLILICSNCKEKNCPSIRTE